MLIDCHIHMFSEDELREAGDAPVVAFSAATGHARVEADQATDAAA